MFDGLVAILQTGTAASGDAGTFGINFRELGLNLGTGGLIGAIIGFAAKKIAKILAVIIGIELALFKFLESRGILTVDWEALTAGLLDAGSSAAGGAPPSWLQTILSTLSITGGFAAGFYIGWRRG